MSTKQIDVFEILIGKCHIKEYETFKFSNIKLLNLEEMYVDLNYLEIANSNFPILMKRVKGFQTFNFDEKLSITTLLEGLNKLFLNFY